jgi:hypothetical protein
MEETPGVINVFGSQAVEATGRRIGSLRHLVSGPSLNKEMPQEVIRKKL